MRVNYIDEIRQSVFAPIMVHIRYEDKRLKWNESASGITSLRIRQTELFQPFIFIYDRTNENENIDLDMEKKEPALLLADGVVWATIWLKDTARCSFDNYHYPFDVQLINLRIHALIGRIRPVSSRKFCYEKFVKPGRFRNSDECMERIRSVDWSMFLANPAGWEISVADSGTDGRNLSFESLQIDDNDSIKLFLKRRVAANSVVWIIFPFGLTTLAVYCIFFAW